MAAEIKMEGTIKPKRQTPKRQREPKKWTEKEVNEILRYMQVHRNLEKPTAQIYYNKLIAATSIDATWNLMQFKVRLVHLKTGWQKAEAFCKSTGAGVEGGDVETTIRAKLLKMCPHYDQLDDIYSSSKAIDVVVVESSNYQELNTPNNIMPFEEDALMDELLTTPMDNSMDANDLDASFVDKTKRKVQNTSLAQVAAIEAGRKEFREKRLVLETDSLKLNQDKFLWDKEIEKRKLDLEDKKFSFEERKLNLHPKRFQADGTGAGDENGDAQT